MQGTLMRHVILLTAGLVLFTGAVAAQDRFVVRDEDGRTTATIERYLGSDMYVIRDRDGRTRGTVAPSRWGEGYTLRDRDGRTQGRFRSPWLQEEE